MKSTREKGESESLSFFTSFAVDTILKGIQKDLSDFDAHFDTWFSEKTLHEEHAVERALGELKEKGHTYKAKETSGLTARALEMIKIGLL